MNSLIGKAYWPIDNSYAVCLFDGRNHHLAGNYSRKAEITTIVSQPFIMLVKTVVGKPKKMEMVLVKCRKGYIHSVMFRNGGLETHDLEEIAMG